MGLAGEGLRHGEGFAGRGFGQRGEGFDKVVTAFQICPFANTDNSKKWGLACAPSVMI